MKVVKGISLFFVILCLVVAGGIYLGNSLDPKQNPSEEIADSSSKQNTDKFEKFFTPGSLEKNQTEDILDAVVDSGKEVKICSDTRYEVEEKDLIKGETIRTEGTIPAKYIGMTRQSFIEAMNCYESSPPLSELERGFVGLQVLSFAKDKVVVQMNYRYIQPGSSFYIACLENEVIVLLEDCKTVYLNTGISMNELPEDVQRQIIHMIYIKNEEELYSFLETYSS